jgi:mannose-6-phosphate isomerase-like protein (cupin superfamily)
MISSSEHSLAENTVARPGNGLAEHNQVLNQLVGLSEPFIARHWGKQEYFCPSDGRASGMQLPSADEILACLDRESINPADIRLMRSAGDPIHQQTWTQVRAMGGYPSSRSIKTGELAKQIRQGSSLVVHDFQRYSASVLDACQRLAARLRTPVRAVVFITPPERTGLKIHRDPTEIFAVQIGGTKEWLVYPQQRPVPRKGGTLPEVPEGGTEFTLRAGDCLYVPAGSPHNTRACSNGISTHISFGVPPLYWRDIIEHMISEALMNSAYAGTVAAEWSNGFPLEADLQQRIQLLSDQLIRAADDMAGLDRFLEERWRRTIYNGNLSELIDHSADFSSSA